MFKLTSYYGVNNVIKTEQPNSEDIYGIGMERQEKDFEGLEDNQLFISGDIETNQSCSVDDSNTNDFDPLVAL